MTPQPGSETDTAQRVLHALKEARSRLEAAERLVTEPIAVVGIGCRFPGGAHGPDAFWRLLEQGTDAVGPIPADRYDAAAYYSATPGAPGMIGTREGAFLDGIDRFDAEFFDMSPREAVSLDPQQRLLLETAWEALEHAGQAPSGLRGTRCGVFVGIGRNDYGHRLLRGPAETFTAWHATGNGLCYGPGRLAHVLDLRGPNMALDTACSASLLAVHLACQSLRLRECDAALAGGSHVHLSPQVAIMLSMSRALAPDGRCKAFDAAADGFGQGEGCGVVLLRRLSDALARDDTILALVRGSAVNHDGHSSGLTVPNQSAQEQVIRDALANARVAANAVGYVEAHGTGTPLGDPIELDALAAVLCAGREPDAPLLVGSVKTNIGHLEAAAGIAGLIKTVLALHHGTVPPHLHFRAPSPRIPWGSLPIRIPTRPTPWPRGPVARLAGVSSFGMSGTNVHVVLQEAPAAAAQRGEPDRPLHAVALSARTPSALRAQAGRLAARLSRDDAPPLADVAFTMNTGRARFATRVGLVAVSADELTRSLAAVASGSRQTDRCVEDDDAEPPGIGFVFSGQGAQYRGMGRHLFDTQKVFREALERCDAILQPLWRTSISDVLFAADGDRRLDQTCYTQPALFALECALAALWRSWGVVPRAVLGHSVGAYAAACVAGVFPLDAGLQLVAERARLMQALPPGTMAAVMAGEDRVRQAIGAHGDDVSIAAVNGAASVVIAGRTGPVRAVAAGLQSHGVRVRELTVSHAFHSPMMEPVLGPFAGAARALSYAAPCVDFVSDATGALHAAAPSAEYWVRHVREPVRFAAALETLAGLGCRALIEIGPGGTLLGMAGRHLADRAPVLLPSLLPNLTPGSGEWQPLLQAMTRLFELGAPVDWTGFDHGYPRRIVSLPTYPFERQRFWYDAPDDPAPANRPVREIPAYRLAWREQPDEAAPTPHRAAPRNWLIVHDGGKLAGALAAGLEARGDACTVAAPDRIIDARRPGGHSDLPESPDWTGIVWLCSATEDARREPSADALMAAQQRNCDGLLHLVRTLAARGAARTRLWVVTRDAVAAGTAPASLPDLSHGALWGLCRVIALEHPGLWGGIIDLSCPDGDTVPALIRELARVGPEDAVLLRGPSRLVARLERLPAPPSRTMPGATPVRAEAGYLITGGLGTLGLRVAERLVEHGARGLMLVGRREPSPAALEKIAALRRHGATVRTAAADVAEIADLRRVFADIATSLPPLRGVVHAAGVFGDRLIEDLDADALRAVLRPKVLGGWLLHQLTAPLDLDLFVCFSSAAALWGSKGQAHYAAANAFLDALARYRHGRGLPALSVAWGPWDDGGMARPEARERLARVGVRSLAPADALDALEAYLGTAEPHIALADIDWAAFAPIYQSGRRSPLIADLAATPTDRTAAAPNGPVVETPPTDALPAERRAWLVEHLRQVLADVLKLGDRRPDARTGFFRLGLDSVMAVELAAQLARDLRQPVSATVIFDHPTIAGLADHLATKVLGWAPEPAPDTPPAPQAPLPGSIASKLARLEVLIREV